MYATYSRTCRAAGVGLLLASVLTGCCSNGERGKNLHVDNCSDIPQGAIPAPNGYFVREWQNRQITKAEADDFVIYLNEWYKGGKILGPYGRYHVDQMAKRLPTVPFPVVIQPSPADDLNQERRTLVVNCLLNAGIADADARVVMGYPLDNGTYGDESERIYFRMLQNQGQFGNNFNNGAFNNPFGFGGGYGGFGGIGGGGLGGFGGSFFR